MKKTVKKENNFLDQYDTSNDQKCVNSIFNKLKDTLLDLPEKLRTSSRSRLWLFSACASLLVNVSQLNNKTKKEVLDGVSEIWEKMKININ